MLERISENHLRREAWRWNAIFVEERAGKVTALIEVPL